MLPPKAVRETGQFSLLYSVVGLLSVQELSTHSPIKNIYLYERFIKQSICSDCLVIRDPQFDAWWW